jgi:hypothetical protein
LRLALRCATIHRDDPTSSLFLALVRHVVTCPTPSCSRSWTKNVVPGCSTDSLTQSSRRKHVTERLPVLLAPRIVEPRPV